MTKRELLKFALQDAISWQISLADAYQKDAPERKEAIDLEQSYRQLMKKRYGTSRLPMEVALDSAKTITLTELRKRHET